MQAPQPHDTFELFWRAYPKRVAKKDAMKAWRKLDPSPELVQRILVALAWQIETDQWQRDDGQYVPYPASYLRGERWDDEPVAPTRAMTKPGYSRTGESMQAAKDSLRARLARLHGDGHDPDQGRSGNDHPQRLDAAVERAPGEVDARGLRRVR